MDNSNGQETCPDPRPSDLGRRGYSRKRTVAYPALFAATAFPLLCETLERAPAIMYILPCAHTRADEGRRDACSPRVNEVLVNASVQVLRVVVLCTSARVHVYAGHAMRLLKKPTTVTNRDYIRVRIVENTCSLSSPRRSQSSPSTRPSKQTRTVTQRA